MESLQSYNVDLSSTSKHSSYFMIERYEKKHFSNVITPSHAKAYFEKTKHT